MVLAACVIGLEHCSICGRVQVPSASAEVPWLILVVRHIRHLLRSPQETPEAASWSGEVFIRSAVRVCLLSCTLPPSVVLAGPYGAPRMMTGYYGVLQIMSSL